MGKQTGILPISGKIGDKIYYARKDKHGKTHYFVRNAPDEVRQTAATQNAAADFGTASHCAKLMRDALKEYTQHYDNGALINSLNKAMGEVVRADAVHKPGHRQATGKNMHLLQGFRFNHQTAIDRLLNETPFIETSDGQITVSLPEISFSRNKALSGVTHLSIKAIALSVNFATQTTTHIASEAVLIRRNDKRQVTFTLNTNNKEITCILLQVQSYYEVNGQLHLSQNKSASAMDLISVIPPVISAKKKVKKLKNKLPVFWSTPAIQIVPKRKKVVRTAPRLLLQE
ncbi:hypothetical protein [Chitinophaga sp. S165]|uniref:hypothetical protein n=1 Tax=Chitinophaga sp. S165 TaxID=2135462 RepID=UPI000D713311|nr:hypothetical protein [Chitinophaga sp. S165]PWV56609.1 hypothetical protein C7475_1011126 [Chitinophaga sp. S165]